LRRQSQPLSLASLAQVDAFLGLLAPMLPEVVDAHLDTQSLAVYDLFMRVWERVEEGLLRHPRFESGNEDETHRRWGLECLAAFDPTARTHLPSLHPLLRIPGAHNQAADSSVALAQRWRDTRRCFASYVADACAANGAASQEENRARLTAHTLAEKRRALVVWVQSQDGQLRDGRATLRLADHPFLVETLATCRATFWAHVWHASVADAARQLQAIRSPCVPVLQLWARATPDRGGWTLDLLALATAWLYAAVAALVHRPHATQKADDAEQRRALVARLERLLEQTRTVDVDRNFTALGLELIYLALTSSSAHPFFLDVSIELSATLVQLIPRTSIAVARPSAAAPSTHYSSMLSLLGIPIDRGDVASL
jgi:hypothetical protein